MSAIRIRNGEAVYQHRVYQAKRHRDGVMLTRVIGDDELGRATEIIFVPSARKRPKTTRRA